MDILIKGMELPKKGAMVFYVQSDGTVTIPNNYKLDFETPVQITSAVDVAPHGDLVDVDRLISHIDSKLTERDRRIGTHDWVISEIVTSPIVIKGEDLSRGVVSDGHTY